MIRRMNIWLPIIRIIIPAVCAAVLSVGCERKSLTTNARDDFGAAPICTWGYCVREVTSDEQMVGEHARNQEREQKR